MTLRVLGRKSSINVRKVLWTCAEARPAFRARRIRPAAAGAQSQRDGPRHPGRRFRAVGIERHLPLSGRQTASLTLLPEDPQARALVEQWMDWQATELNVAWRYAFLGLARKSPAHTDPAPSPSASRAGTGTCASSTIISRTVGSSSPASSSRWRTWCLDYLPTVGCSPPWTGRISTPSRLLPAPVGATGVSRADRAACSLNRRVDPHDGRCPLLRGGLRCWASHGLPGRRLALYLLRPP